MSEKVLNVKVLETGAVECSFSGGHITKREFDRLLRVVNKNYRDGIRLFRQSRKVENNGKPGAESGTGTGTAAATGIKSAIAGSNSSSGIPETAKPVVTATTVSTATAKAG